jgi:hypothetical protein
MPGRLLIRRFPSPDNDRGNSSSSKSVARKRRRPNEESSSPLTLPTVPHVAASALGKTNAADNRGVSHKSRYDSLSDTNSDASDKSRGSDSSNLLGGHRRLENQVTSSNPAVKLKPYDSLSDENSDDSSVEALKASRNDRPPLSSDLAKMHKPAPPPPSPSNFANNNNTDDSSAELRHPIRQALTTKKDTVIVRRVPQKTAYDSLSDEASAPLSSDESIWQSRHTRKQEPLPPQNTCSAAAIASSVPKRTAYDSLSDEAPAPHSSDESEWQSRHTRPQEQGDSDIDQKTANDSLSDEKTNYGSDSTHEVRDRAKGLGPQREQSKPLVDHDKSKTLRRYSTKNKVAYDSLSDADADNEDSSSVESNVQKQQDKTRQMIEKPCLDNDESTGPLNDEFVLPEQSESSSGSDDDEARKPRAVKRSRVESEPSDEWIGNGTMSTHECCSPFASLPLHTPHRDVVDLSNASTCGKTQDAIELDSGGMMRQGLRSVTRYPTLLNCLSSVRKTSRLLDEDIEAFSDNDYDASSAPGFWRSDGIVAARELERRRSLVSIHDDDSYRATTPHSVAPNGFSSAFAPSYESHDHSRNGSTYRQGANPVNDSRLGFLGRSFVATNANGLGSQIRAATDTSAAATVRPARRIRDPSAQPRLSNESSFAKRLPAFNDAAKDDGRNFSQHYWRPATKRAPTSSVAAISAAYRQGADPVNDSRSGFLGRSFVATNANGLGSQMRAATDTSAAATVRPAPRIRDPSAQPRLSNESSFAKRLPAFNDAAKDDGRNFSQHYWRPATKRAPTSSDAAISATTTATRTAAVEVPGPPPEDFSSTWAQSPGYPLRNDITGGSGVGAGSYQVERHRNNENEAPSRPWHAPPRQRSSSKKQGRPSSCGGSKSTTKRRNGFYRGLGRGGRRGGGGGRGGRRSAPASSGNWAGNVDDPNLKHVGGAEMSF